MESDLVKEKFDDYKASIQEYDAVVIGSSKVYRHISPKIIGDKTGLNLFNFGIPHLLVPRSIELAKKLVIENPSLKILVFELSTPILANRGLSESIYSIDHNDTYKLLKHYLTIDYSLDFKRKNIRRVVNHWGFKYFGFGLSTTANRYFDTQMSTMEVPKSNGYISLEHELKITNDPMLKKRKNSVLSEIELENIKKINSSQIFDIWELDPLSNDVLQLIEFCESNNVKLIYLISPLWFTRDQIKYIQSLKGELGEKYIIDLSIADKYPEFYMRKHLFDKGHLNDSGSEIFSKLLAELIANKLSGTRLSH
ncbi:MAG: hypothetical protein RJQ09_04705 [Cyclobacteriaceae bacterium]